MCRLNENRRGVKYAMCGGFLETHFILTQFYPLHSLMHVQIDQNRSYHCSTVFIICSICNVVNRPSEKAFCSVIKIGSAKNGNARKAEPLTIRLLVSCCCEASGGKCQGLPQRPSKRPFNTNTQVLYHMFETYSEMGPARIIYTDVLSGLASFLVVAIGGTVIGIVWGFATGFVTRFTHQVRVIEPIFIFVMAYLAYLSAEIFHLSGILA